MKEFVEDEDEDEHEHEEEDELAHTWGRARMAFHRPIAPSPHRPASPLARPPISRLFRGCF